MPIILRGLVLLSLLLPLLGPARADDAARFAGRYCGKLWSAGVLVKAITVLHLRADGRLDGTYTFDDLGATTGGTLLERPGGAGATRSFDWSDVYGTGTLTVTFDKTGSSFSGKWGALDEEPDAIWDGSEGGCEPSTS